MNTVFNTFIQHLEAGENISCEPSKKDKHRTTYRIGNVINKKRAARWSYLIYKRLGEFPTIKTPNTGVRFLSYTIIWEE